MPNKDVGRTSRLQALGLGLLALGLCLVIASAISGPVQAAGYSQVILHPGNVNSCADVGFSQTIVNTGTTPPAGTTTINGVTFTVNAAQDTVVSWSSTVPIGAVVMKGGPDAFVYVYSPPALSDPSANLVSPPNPGGSTPTISHVLFCNNGDTATNTPTTTPTGVATETTTPTATTTTVVTQTGTPSATTTAVATVTPSPTATTTGTPPATTTPVTQTPTAIATGTLTVTATATGSPVLTSTPTVSVTAEGTATSTPTGVATGTPTLVPTATATSPTPGSITIVKATNPPTGESFTFTGGGSSFVLGNGGSAAFNNLAPGVYTFAEIGLPAGWQLFGINCSGTALSNLTLNPGTSALTVNLPAGDNVTCVFTNTALPIQGGGQTLPPGPPTFTAQVLGVAVVSTPTPAVSLPPAQAGAPGVVPPAPTSAFVSQVGGVRVIAPPNTGDGPVAQQEGGYSYTLRALSLLLGAAMVTAGITLTVRASLKKD